MQCPSCGAQGVQVESRDMSYAYRGQRTLIAAVSGAFCNACSEAVLHEGEAERVAAAMQAFVRQVDGAVVG
jgi:HTH-type transcriptional regulator/antitoxin MqsA